MKTVFGLLILAVTLPFSLCYAGVESSGGADKYVPEQAWFLSPTHNSTIRTCMVVSDTFGIPRDRLEAVLNEAFQKWGSYIQNKRIESGVGNFTTTLKLAPTCDGSEDLKVYFGVTDDQVAEAKKKYVKPFGFVQTIGAHPADQTWAKGFLYVTDPAEISPSFTWTTGNHLLGLLLHEVGHILGCSHLSDTIMAQDIGDEFLFSNETDTLDRIDRKVELRACERCKRNYRSLVSFDFGSNLEKTFKRLIGHDANGPVVAIYQQDEMIEHVNEDELPSGTLSLSDASGTTVFQIQGLSKLAFAVETGSPLFVTPTSSEYSYGEVVLGTLTASGGSVTSVALNYNMDEEAFQIKILDGQPDPGILFAADGSNLSQ